MTSLILMYVFFDKNGDIKAITPHLDEGFSITFSAATFPLSEVEMFLTSEKNTFDFMVKKIEKISGTSYKIVKKQSTIKYTRTLDSYLTKVEDVERYKTILAIVNDNVHKHVYLELDIEFKEMYLKTLGTEEEQEITSNFFNGAPSAVYLTKKNNPYYLLFSFSFTPKDFLTSDRLYFNYEGEYNDSSAYTKKLINGYGYKEKVF